MAKDYHAEALSRYEEAVSYWSETHERIKEDFRFSNPADPEQWDSAALVARKGRPCLAFDRTNQFIAQVVNDARQNKPAIHTMPVDSKGDVRTAQVIDGLIRHIEYTSRADQAYDTAIEHAARGGLGWLRVVPVVIDRERNQQDIRILRIHDPLSCLLDPASVAPDGADATWGFVTTRIKRAAFQRDYPKASLTSWNSSRDLLWGDRDDIVIAEYFAVIEEKRNRIVVDMPEGERLTLPEDDYWSTSRKVGFQPKVAGTFAETERRIVWCKLTGDDVIEETEFPSRYIPLVPVYGDELWIENKRYLCGMVRKLRAGQQAYNYERNAAIEYVATQPKAPVMVPMEAVEGLDQHWQKLNQGNPAFLPYHARTSDGQQLPMPTRLDPPTLPTAFTALGQVAYADMEASVGMYRSALGQQSNAVSGRAKQADRMESDTATFHYPDNLSRSIAHLGRIIVDMLPHLFDSKRSARIIGEDGKHEFVSVEPGLSKPRTDGKRTLAISLDAGRYDVRMTSGAAYTTQRQESAQGIEQILQAVPALSPALVPALMKLRDWPDAEKYSRMVLALAPPELRQIAEGLEQDEGEAPRIPAAMQAAMQQAQQQLQALQQALQQASADVQRLAQENETLKADKSLQAQKAQADAQIGQGKLQVDAFNAETTRIKVLAELQQREAEVAQRAASSQAQADIDTLTALAQPIDEPT